MYLVKQKEDQSNKITWSGDPEGFIRSVRLEEYSKFPLLSGIALYEDTYFNSQQVKNLVSELENFKRYFSKEEDISELNSMIEFSKKVNMQELLVFIGD